MASPSFVDSSASALAAAWSAGTATAGPFEARTPDREEAYAIQDRVVELLSARLGPRVGWKLGMTAPGIASAPLVGPIHRAMIIASGSSIQVRPGVLIEVEIALHLRPDADPDRLVPDDLEVGAAFELLARRTPSLDVCDGIADLATMEHVVLGPTRPLAEVPDLGSLKGSLTIDTETIATAVSHQAVAPPLDSLAWLREHLKGRARHLSPGDAVITGSLVGQVPIRPGAAHLGTITGLEPVSLRVEA